MCLVYLCICLLIYWCNRVFIVFIYSCVCVFAQLVYLFILCIVRIYTLLYMHTCVLLCACVLVY